ncbi:MAG: hypothetical protein NTV48_00420, partial [Candidatus Vogelbacteria bacterium]|nr:hypothetical protein [Candidatus Vogelbacteria bacterium]
MVCSAKYASVVPSLIEKSVGTLKFNDSKIPPSIALRSGPNNLKVGDSGTWQILEFYPANTTDKLSYYSVWGDETVIPNVFKYVGANNASGADNGSKFIHAYQKAGTYHP